MNKRVSGNAKPMAVGLAMGCGISLTLTLAGAALITNLVLSQKITAEAIGYGAVAVLLLSSTIGAWISYAMIKRRRMVVCLASGVIYYLLLISITALFFGGQYQGMGVTALLIIGGSGSVALLGTRGVKPRSKRCIKRSFR